MLEVRSTSISRVVVAHPPGEPEAIHGAGHDNIAEDDVDRDLRGLQDGDRLFGVGRLMDLVPAFAEIFRDDEPDQHLVLDHEDGCRSERSSLADWVITPM